MSGFQIAFETSCGVILVLLAFVVFLIHLAREAQKQRDVAQAVRNARATTVLTQDMAKAQMAAAPTDADLDRRLQDGTF